MKAETNQTTEPTSGSDTNRAEPATTNALAVACVVDHISAQVDLLNHPPSPVLLRDKQVWLPRSPVLPDLKRSTKKKMRYIVKHPEDFGMFLLVVGLLCFALRKKIADWKTPPAKERMVAAASREMTESLVKVASLLAITTGFIVIAAKWYFERT